MTDSVIKEMPGFIIPFNWRTSLVARASGTTVRIANNLACPSLPNAFQNMTPKIASGKIES